MSTAMEEPRDDMNDTTQMRDTQVRSADQRDRSMTDTSDTDTLMPGEDLAGFRDRWNTIQTRFVDEPRTAVQEADALVDEVTRKLTDSFNHARSTLEERWGRDEDVSTEDLRVVLQRYRSFFDRLLAA
jgi:hypothetical protein